MKCVTNCALALGDLTMVQLRTRYNCKHNRLCLKMTGISGANTGVFESLERLTGDSDNDHYARKVQQADGKQLTFKYGG